MLYSLGLLADAYSDDLDVRLALAERQLTAGNAEAARKWAEDCLVIDTYNIKAYTLLAKAQMKLEKWEDAEKAITTALKLEPEEQKELNELLDQIRKKVK